MKRVLTFLAIMLLPLSVMAMTPVSDQTLSDVTGQAGVNINADLTMNIEIGTLAWGDEDGIGTLTAYGWAPSTGGGYVGLSSFNINNLTVKAREDDSNINYWVSTYLYGGTVDVLFNYSMLKPITIDVATGGNHAGTYVRFGLGSLEIKMNSMKFFVNLGTDPSDAATFGEELGMVYIGDLGLYINPVSYVDIFNGTGTTSGVTLDMYVVIDKVDLEVLAWGDSDGTGTTADGFWMDQASEGWVGLASINMGAVVIDGAVNININSCTTGIYTHSDTAIYGTGQLGPKTVIRISFGEGTSPFSLDVIGPIEAMVKLDSAATFDSGYAGTLGDIYLSGFGVDIAAGSWVDIWAH